MLEAPARFRLDSLGLNTARMPARDGLGATLASLGGRLPARARIYAGAALAAVMAGIVINALTLQRARHPNPLFAASPASPPVAAVNPPAPPPPVVDPPVAGPAPVSAPPPAAPAAPPAPPVRPASLGAANLTVAPRRSADPIADILRGGANRDARRLMAAAQNALIRLGYTVRTSADATAALREFEKSHGLPPSTEVTPRLLKLLTATATATAAR